MDDFEGSYAPQSPDLSGFNDFDEPEPAFPESAPPFSTSYHAPQPNSFHQPYVQQPQPYAPYSFNQPSFPNSQYSVPGAPNQEVQQPMGNPNFIPEPKSATTKPGPGRKKKPKVEEVICEKPAPGVEEGIEVKTKFPVARIKRIMQADEDVGKVAQVTPTAVSKALELFMISIVTKAAQKAREKSARKVTPVHLKQALQDDEQFDFLADIIAKVPAAPAAKKKEDTDDSEEVVETKAKKRGPRKRKADDEEED